ncbi:MAG: DUF4836 family protein [Flavobacteriales bacterium]|nr:DUF4836 family protein [Flavobacteriales bacterium]
MKFTKNINLSFLISLAASLFFASCSRKPAGLSPIPKDANFVMVVDAKSMHKKGELGEFVNSKVYKWLRQEFRKNNKKLSEILEEAIEDPKKCGIDLRDEIFVYVLNETKSKSYTCVSLSMRDKETFEDFFENILDNTKVRNYDDWEDRGGLKPLHYTMDNQEDYDYFIIGNNEMAVGYDDDKIVAVIPNGFRTKDLDVMVEDAMTNTKDNGMMANKDFEEFIDEHGDISVWFNTSLIDENISNYERKNIKVNLADNLVMLHTNFNDGEIAVTTHYKPNEEMSELLEKHKYWDHAFNSDLLDLLPEKSFGLGSFSINMEDYYHLLEKQMDVKDIEDGQIDIQEIMTAFGGSFLFSMYDFDDLEYADYDYEYGLWSEEELSGEMEMEDAEEVEEYDIEEELLRGTKWQNSDEFYVIPVQENPGERLRKLLEDREMNDFNFKVPPRSQNGKRYGYKKVKKIKKTLMPYMALAFDIADEKVFEDWIEKMEKKVEKRDGYYKYSLFEKYAIYFAIKDKKCLITNDDKVIKKFEGEKQFDKTLADGDFKDELTKSIAFGYFNLNVSKYPREVRNRIEKDMDAQEETMLDIWSDVVEGIQFKSTKMSEAEFKFLLNDKKQNSIKTLLNATNDNWNKFVDR